MHRLDGLSNNDGNGLSTDDRTDCYLRLVIPLHLRPGEIVYSYNYVASEANNAQFFN